MSCSSFVVFWPKLSDWLFTSWNIYLDFLRPELLLAELPLSPNQPVSELFQLKRSGGYGYWPFFFLTSLLEYNCFTLLCSFLLHNKVNQLYVYIYPHISSLLHLPPSHPPNPTPLGGHKAPSWSPCAMRLFPTSYLFYVWECIYVHPTLSLRPSLPFPLPVSSSPFSTSASLFLSCP